MSSIAVLTPYATDAGADLSAALAVGSSVVRLINNRPVLVCPQGLDAGGVWMLTAPVNLTMPLQIVISYAMETAVTGAVKLGARIEAISEADATDLDATSSFDAVNTVVESVPATAGILGQAVITLTSNDSIAIGDYVRVMVWRVGTDGANDNAAGALCLLAAELRDSNPAAFGTNVDALGGYPPTAYAVLGQHATFATIAVTQMYTAVNVANITFTSAGWKKIGYWQASSGRGQAKVIVTNPGTNRTLSSLSIYAVTGNSWAANTGSLFCHGGTDGITGVRVTNDGTYKYLEINHAYASAGLIVGLRQDIGGWQQYPFTFYTTEVNSPGTDTVVITVAAGTGAISSTGYLYVNDGAGSGIDADLLDGQQGSYYLPAASYTAADVKAKILTIDGAGSTIDADLLDGVQGSGYVLTTAYDAADVMTKLLTVDGSGSALDADLLDGVAHYATAAFTPSLAFDGLSTGITYAIRVGRYIKFGKLVYFSVTLQLSSKGTATGSASITGLPFVSATVTNSIWLCEFLSPNQAGSQGFANGMARVQSNVSEVELSYTGLASGLAFRATDITFSDTDALYVTGFYESAS